MMSNMYDSTTTLNYGNLKSSMNYSTLSLMSIISTAPSVNKHNEFNSKEFVFCLTRKSMMSSKELMAAIQHLNPEYTIADTEDDLTHLVEERRKYYFICDTFHGDLFNLLRKKSCRICAPPFLIYIHNRKRPIPETSRPLFNGSMFGVAVCFTGFATKREVVSQLADLVHFMGGSVRKDFSGKITHVVANLAQGQKYKAAVNLGKHIMTEQWVLEAWENRHDVSFKATRTEFVDQYQMKPFHGLKLSFLGFSAEETQHMEETTLQNGGEFFPIGSDGCSHLVIEETYSSELPQDIVKVVHVVKQEWFWASIQLDACAEESMYFFIDEQGTPFGTGNQRMKKKRKFLNASDLSDLLSPGSPLISNKRRSKEGRLSVISSATFDSSMGSPFSTSNFDSPEVKEASAPRKPLTVRHQTCLELQQTERNYVDVLRTVMKIFKEPLEQSADQRGGALLSAEEIKTIFGSIPELLKVHEILLASLDELLNTWSEENLVGKAVADCADAMIKAYPGFVNFFEMIKETIVRCDKERPRFHAFLKICLTKPDCGRQSLTELLIRPVQRIPSMSLLLNDILKHTPDSNPDHVFLKQAAESIKNVLTYINEDKRKTEHQVQMFEIIREVDNCPAYILSSHRSLVATQDVMEVSEGLILKCDFMTMFLFNDSIEIAKKRNRGAGNTVTLKSPAIQNIQRGTQQKTYKHVEFLQLAHLKSVVDIKDEEDLKDMFGLIYHSSVENKDKLGIFKLSGGTCSKVDWMTKIVKCLSDTKCMADTENALITIDAQELLLDKSSDLSEGKDRGGSISKVFKKAKGGFTKKVSRAFSLNKTPKQQQPSSKSGNQTLRRAMSSITPVNDGKPMTPSVISPTPMEYTIMDVSVCEDK